MAKEIGKIGWIDLSVNDADSIKDFYNEVVGWEVSEFPVATYKDYCVAPPTEAGGADPVAGICHSRGPNVDIPPNVWLIYITVENLDKSIEACKRLGGETLTQPRDMGGYGKVCVIRDPAGTISAIIEQPE